MSDFNVPCKFIENEEVYVCEGFHKGKIGKIKDVHCGYKPIGLTRKVFDGLQDEISYEVKVGWFRTIYVYESQLIPNK